MAGPASPGTDGPTFSPPTVPAGWIAQWDGASQQYYYVQLSTGVSQWEVPTEDARTGTTPTPSQNMHQVPEVITHPDGSQTIKHPDGTMEPILPPGDAARAVDGPSGDRGFGSVAMNALLGGGKNPGHGGAGHGQGGHGALNLAQQFIGGSDHHGGGKQSHGAMGKIVSGLASSLIQGQGNNNKPSPPQNYHGGHTQGQNQHHSASLGGLVGGVASHILGGKHHGPSTPHANYGYSNVTSDGSYAGQAPPSHYGSSSSGQPPLPPPPSGSIPGSGPPLQHPYLTSPPQQLPPGWVPGPPPHAPESHQATHTTSNAYHSASSYNPPYNVHYSHGQGAPSGQPPPTQHYGTPAYGTGPPPPLNQEQSNYGMH